MIYNCDMTSLLTSLRPDLWSRGLGLLGTLAPYTCPPKEPLADGSIYACGGVVEPLYIPGITPPPAPPSEPPSEPPPEPDPEKKKEEERRKKAEEKERERIKKAEDDATTFYRKQAQKIKKLEDLLRQKILNPIGDKERRKAEIEKLRRQLEEAKKEEHTKSLAPVVAVPEGAMEWLLHEAGHWIVASDEERQLPNYGLNDDVIGTVGGYQKIAVPTSGLLFEREWQAWAFEEIILAPFGPSRSFAPPTQRDGVAFAKAGPVPAWALAHAERRINETHVDIERWRSVFGEWVRFERTLPAPSWERLQ